MLTIEKGFLATHGVDCGDEEVCKELSVDGIGEIFPLDKSFDIILIRLITADNQPLQIQNLHSSSSKKKSNSFSTNKNVFFNWGSWFVFNWQRSRWCSVRRSTLKRTPSCAGVSIPTEGLTSQPSIAIGRIWEVTMCCIGWKRRQPAPKRRGLEKSRRDVIARAGSGKRSAILSNAASTREIPQTAIRRCPLPPRFNHALCLRHRIISLKIVPFGLFFF